MNTHNEALAIVQAHGGSLCSASERLYIGPSLDRDKVDRAIKAYAKSADPEDVVCMVDDSILQNGSSGFLFTSTKLYRTRPPFKPQKIWFDEIGGIEVFYSTGTDSKPVGVRLEMQDGSIVRLVNNHVNAQALADVIGLLKDNVENRSYEGVGLPDNKSDDVYAAEGLAVAYADCQVGERIVAEEKFGGRGGHGFAAERANDLIDRIHGKDAVLLGDDNAKDGPDRAVDGVWIQSKYCSNGKDCIDHCFSNGGKGDFRYFAKDGKPMVIEVPKDEAIYQKAVERMEQKILEGKVPGVTDAAEAENIVQRGNVTYQQAKNIAKAGNVDSILYDSANSLVTCASAFGLSAAVVFATSVWNDDPVDVALKRAAYQGLKIGGSTFIASVLASQLSKAGLNSVLVGGSEKLIGLLGPKVSALLANGLRSGKDIYGAAAMKSVGKLLRSNFITAVATVAVLSSFDVANIFRGRISGAQLVKNVVGTTSAVGGGVAGWVGGAAVGSAVLPGVGTIIGGLVGSMVAGGLSGKAANLALGQFIEDDANKMVEIVQSRFQKLAEDYLLNRSEAEKTIDALSAKLDGGTLKKMFASRDRDSFADDLLIPLIEERVSKRPHVSLPSPENMSAAMQETLEELADAAEAEGEEI